MLNVNVLTINPDIVCRFIERAREFHAKEEVCIPEATPQSEYEYDWAQILAKHQDDQTYLEIKQAINALPYDKQLDLLALMHLGRDDLDDWSKAMNAAVNHFPDNVTDYLLSHPALPVYLTQALDKLGFHWEE